MSGSWSKNLVVTVSVEPDDPAMVGRTGSYRSLDGLARFHELCRRHGVRPTYLLTYSAAGEARCVELARSCAAASQAGTGGQRAGTEETGGRGSVRLIAPTPERRGEQREDAEFGAHLHPEEVPPIAPAEAGRHTLRPSDVEPERLRAKLANLAARVAEATGRRPTSYRAGFFDLTAVQAAALIELGFEADSSLGPLEKTREGYPFLGIPFAPYVVDPVRPTRQLDRTDCRLPIAKCQLPNAEPSSLSHLPNGQSAMGNRQSEMLVEVPMTTVFRRPFARALFGAYFALPGPVRGALRTLGLAELLRLRPAVATEQELLAVCQRTERLGIPAVMSIHSNELAAGTSASVRTQADSAAYFERLESVFAAVQEQGWTSLTLTEVARKLRQGGS